MKIYSDRKYLPEGFPHCTLLYPFWGIPPTTVNALSGGRPFARYLETGRDAFHLSGLDDARAVVLPFDWRCVGVDGLRTRIGVEGRADAASAARAAEDFSEAASGAGKPVGVFFTHDDADKVVPLDDCVTFRPSLLRSSRRPKEFALPAWVADEVESSMGGQVSLRRKGARPVVGFCGLNPERPAPERRRGAAKVKGVLRDLRASFSRRAGPFSRPNSPQPARPPRSFCHAAPR